MYDADHLEFRANSFALNPEGNWYTFVRVHPAAFHAFLSAIAILRSFQLGIPDMVSVLNHRNEAVRLINKDLADNTSLSDQLITAVSSLVVAEVWLASATELSECSLILRFP